MLFIWEKKSMQSKHLDEFLKVFPNPQRQKRLQIQNQASGLRPRATRRELVVEILFLWGQIHVTVVRRSLDHPSQARATNTLPARNGNVKTRIM
jgi:hypothetical protein